MIEHVEIRADFNYLYRDDQKFFPVIQDAGHEFHPLEAANAVVIKLPAKINDELIWEKERALAEKLVEEGKLIMWELDFGLEANSLDFSDSSVFYSLGIAIDEFVNSLWRDLKDSSLGVILYRGDVGFSKNFIWNDEHKQLFLEKHATSKNDLVNLIDVSGDEWYVALEDNKLFKLFAADIFSEYFQRLVSYLPDEALPFCLFDVSEQTDLALLAQLLSKDRFQHILLALKKSTIPAGHLNWEEGCCLGGWIGRGSPYFSAVSEVNLAVCLPGDEYMTPSVSESLGVVLQDLSSRGVSYRIIPENLLTEAWDGIDSIIIISNGLSYQGKRRLQGFCAAGGRVVSLGDLNQLSNEILYPLFQVELASQEALFNN
ncbi:MAG: hypothetical protein FJZ57_04360 [Chlamydiae bacterium]|nr:hypothetical protein [Chlamydiota bacterium]